MKFYECNHFLLSDGISSVCIAVKSWPGSEIWSEEFNFVSILQGAALKHFPRAQEYKIRIVELNTILMM